MASPLLSLPSELLQHILGYLSLSEILATGLVCRALHEHTQQDVLWQPFVQAEVPGRAVSKPAHLTWQELFKEHHPYWFIARRKIWFADNAHTGKLIVARYDHRLNSIEAYALVAERRIPASLSWDQHPEAIIHTFSPRVQLDLNAPVVRLNKDAYEEAQRIIRISDEVRVSVERVLSEPDPVASEDEPNAEKLTTSKLGQKLGLKTAEVLERAAAAGYVEALSDGKYGIAAKGEQSGVEYVAKSRFGPYFLWPVDFQLGQEAG